jgi:crotonobetainyl-CoA:carnitine CoA-transferase CaiB-like acyl-CoA transferase
MLKGIKVLDLSRVLAGPYATQYLGDLGATIFKIEKPKIGDDTRSWYPPFSNEANMSAYFMSCNRNKKSVAINISHPRGQDLILDLAKQCDVMIENFQVGKLAEYGLDYDSIKKIKQDMIYVSVSGYGQTGSKRDLPGYDFIVQGESGLMSITGEETPMKVGVAISDVMTGMHAVNGILASIIHRGQTGRGQYIDLSLFDSSLSYLANQGMNYLVSGNAPNRRGNSVDLHI